MDITSTPVDMLHLNLLPAEILHNILRFVDPRDLATLPRVCRYLHGYVQGNQRLCRDIYLHHMVLS